MAWAPPIPMGTGSLFLLLVTTGALTLKHSTAATDGAGSSSLALPGCLDKCGNVSIPYPFGIGGGKEGCFLEGFHVYCDDQTPYLTSDKNLKVLEVNLSQGEVRVQKRIAIRCDKTNTTGKFWLSNRNLFAVSTKNRFTAIGCATIGMIHGMIQGMNQNQQGYTSACGSFCREESINNSTNCTGMGCCQIPIPPNLRTLRFNFVTLDDIDYSAVRRYSPCSYAFVAEADRFKFNTSYATTREFETRYGEDGRGVPMVVDWVVDNVTCVEAKKNSSYACVSMKSECINAPNALGYRCICAQGYDGNPYLKEGCKDIDECGPLSPQYPCHGTCSNTIGNYSCSCPQGTHSEDPKTAPCTPITSQTGLKLVIGICIGLIVLVICIFALVIYCQKRKLAKEKERLFKQNGGQILYQKILSQQVDTVTIFTIEDLQTATNNFDKSREVGTGGHGTVYKGILRDKKLVAVKRSKVMNVSETDEFVQEIIILSQTNHKNVVRLLGCCFEVEVPILVYEFIPNGTLFHLIHDSDGRPPLSLEVRLRIAQESAEALEYLHLSINRPIVHGDVKCLNILLDENFMAKVTDFGASRLLLKDSVQFMTVVQGTRGYLDPEYLQDHKLTEKSDVYSFGVVLLELITRKPAIYSEGLERGKCLASSFIQAMKENRVEDMLDSSIMYEGMEELLREVSALGSQCCSIKREERPSMTQVTDKLKAVRSTWRELLLLKHNESELPIQNSGANAACRLSPSMNWTARMMGMDVEAPPVSSSGSTTSMGQKSNSDF